MSAAYLIITWSIGKESMTGILNYGDAYLVSYLKRNKIIRIPEKQRDELTYVTTEFKKTFHTRLFLGMV